MTYILPILLNLIRFAWLWPWLLLVQSFLAPSHDAPILRPWLLVVVPLLSFLSAIWVSNQNAPISTDDTEPTGMELLRRTGRSPGEDIGWISRLLVAFVGLVVILGVTWWHLYAQSIAWFDPRWLYELGYTLTHWGTQEIPPAVITIGILVYLWLNGMGDAIRAMTHDDIWGTLIRSVVAIVLYVTVLTIAEQPLPTHLFYLIVLLFGSGMLALAFSSLKITVGLDRALGLGQRRLAAVPTLSRYWLSSVLVTVFGLLGVGVLVALFLAPEQLAAMMAVATAVLRWIGAIVGRILLAISYVLFMILYFIMQLFAPLLERMLEQMDDNPLTTLMENMPETEQMEEVAQGAATVPDPYRWAALALVIGLVIIAFALSVRRLRTTPAAPEDETRESILTTDLLQEQLGGLWNRWFQRRRGAQDPFLSLDGESDLRRRIRARYQELLAGAATIGAARTPAETPQEYGRHLSASWQTPQHPSDVAADLATLTAAYQQARYGADTPSAAEVDAAEGAWQRLLQRLRPVADDVPSDKP